MTDHTTPPGRPEPLDRLALPAERQTPNPLFAHRLRTRLVAALGLDEAELDLTDLPTITLPRRSTTMSNSTDSTPATAAHAVTPYLTVSDGTGALDWYARAFGAVETFRVAGDDGRLGHAEFEIGAARFMMSDEYPEMGVVAPDRIGGTSTALHLDVADVDAMFARAVAAGATSQMEPADQPHGARHGSLVDPYGHRWMLSQQLEDFDLGTYSERSEGTGFTVTAGQGGGGTAIADTHGHIWASVYYSDARAGIAFMTDVLGFEEQLVVTEGDHDPNGDPDKVIHSELLWPEGGIVSPGTYDADNVYVTRLPPGSQALYVVTADPQAVHDRCVAAGAEIIAEPHEEGYDPGGMTFSLRDFEGNIWSFGTYAGGAGLPD